MSGELIRFWGSDNWQPPRRSWPYPPTRLERLAERLGIDDEELREILRAEIERHSVRAVETPGRKNGPAA